MLLELHHKPDIHQPVEGPPMADAALPTLDSNMTIGMAIGIVMQRYALTAERAHVYLVSVSQNGHVTLLTLAKQLVDEANCGSGRLSRSAGEPQVTHLNGRQP